MEKITIYKDTEKVDVLPVDLSEWLLVGWSLSKPEEVKKEPKRKSDKH